MMNPVSLLTGYYGAGGELIHHVAHVGTLYLPREALDLVEATALINNEPTNNDTDSNDAAATVKGGGNKKEESLTLPGLDSVIRPSMDTASSKTITVMEV